MSTTCRLVWRADFVAIAATLDLCFWHIASFRCAAIDVLPPLQLQPPIFAHQIFSVVGSRGPRTKSRLQKDPADRLRRVRHRSTAPTQPSRITSSPRPDPNRQRWVSAFEGQGRQTLR